MKTGELINLWYLSRCALAGTQCGRYARLLWASGEYAKAHPETTSTEAYKALDAQTRGRS